MFELTKESAVKEVISKRFGKSTPDEVDELLEVNIWYPADNNISQLGICVELKIEDNLSENYQVNKDGIVYSWGDSPIIDDRSQYTEIKLDKIYSALPEIKDDDDDSNDL